MHPFRVGKSWHMTWRLNNLVLSIVLGEASGNQNINMASGLAGPIFEILLFVGDLNIRLIWAASS